MARYVLFPGVVLGLSELLALILGAGFPRADMGLSLLLLPPGGLLSAWVVAVVTDRRRQAWRLWGPWVPCAPLLLALIVVMQVSREAWPRDDTGFAMLVCFAVLQLAAGLAALGSLAALVYRPDRHPAPPAQ